MVWCCIEEISSDSEGRGSSRTRLTCIEGLQVSGMEQTQGLSQHRCVVSRDRMNHFSFPCVREEMREGFFNVSGEFWDRRRRGDRVNHSINGVSPDSRKASTGTGGLRVSGATVPGVASLSVFTEGESV